MQQGIRALATCVALALVATVAAPAIVPSAHVAQAAASSTPKAATKATKKKARVKTYQFTGVVVAMSKSSFTVEKGKKKPTRRVFSKYEKMRVKGEIEKGARVTVYYRKQGDEAIAHRVVVKETPSEQEG